MVIRASAQGLYFHATSKGNGTADRDPYRIRSGRNRLEALRTLAAETGLGCVLKDSVTLIQKGEGRTYLNPTGNSAMQRAGSGDVLAGIIAGLLAQGISCEAAALLGTWLHGRAGDLAREEKREIQCAGPGPDREAGPGHEGNG